MKVVFKYGEKQHHMSRHLFQPAHLGTQPKTTMGTDREPTIHHPLMGLLNDGDSCCIIIESNKIQLSRKVFLISYPR